jgi:hypothetical protein
MKTKPPFYTSILAFAIIALLVSHHAEGKQPNIIYINTDDWGIGKVPCYKMDAASERIIKTPNIDRFRKEGMLFDLSKDIGETKDLAHAHPELVEKIKGIMKKEHSPHPYWNLNQTNNGVRKPRKKKK